MSICAKPLSCNRGTIILNSRINCQQFHTQSPESSQSTLITILSDFNSRNNTDYCQKNASTNTSAVKGDCIHPTIETTTPSPTPICNGRSNHTRCISRADDKISASCNQISIHPTSILQTARVPKVPTPPPICLPTPLHTSHAPLPAQQPEVYGMGRNKTRTG